MITNLLDQVSNALSSIKFNPGIIVMGLISSRDEEEFCEPTEENIIGTVNDGGELTIEQESPHSWEEMMKKFEEMAVDIDPDEWRQESMFWRAAAALTCSKAASRAQEFACRMQGEKARRTMKRRKLLHAEGHFPDMACGL